jgi:hypothetical protein
MNVRARIARFLGGPEPALILGVISAALSLAVTLGAGLTSDQAGGWVAVISGVFAALTAAVTRPIAPAAFTGLVTVTAALLGAYHYHVPGNVIAATNALIIAGLALLTRGQVSPSTTKAPPTSARAVPAGPSRDA